MDGFNNYNFAGPGTHLKERLARGDRPINALDAAAMRHDMDYARPGVTNNQIRASDNRLVGAA
jgi:hypothetical protein